MAHYRRLLALGCGLCLALAAQAAEDADSPFGDALPLPSTASSQGVKGFLQFEAARTSAAPVHWSKLRTRAELGSQGSFGEGIRWKLGARVDYDAVYSIDDYYSSEVARNQRTNLELRENYLDFSAGGLDFRIGRQHVVWGEMVGLFFADVVSARDQREFILPEFDQMRIPQWAARAEYFSGDFHAEALWIPVASYDNIGKPGAEFFPWQPLPPGAVAQYRQELRPERNADNMNWGLRLSLLKNGWDVSGFYYRSTDISPTFYREPIVAPDSPFIFQARHDRIEQVGGTLAKDFGDIVLKGEAVHTRGRKFTVLDLSDADGVARQDTLDWAAGLEFTLPAEKSLNVQVFQRRFFEHNPSLIPDARENGYSVLLKGKFSGNWEAQALLISSFNRSDWLFRPRLSWNFARNWRWVLGADIFTGPPLGMFGRYDRQDRVYSEVRYSF